MTFSDILLIAGGITFALVVVGFWFAPAKTARTSALLFSFLRNVLRLKREAKSDAPETPTRKSAPKDMGTISAYLDDVTPKKKKDDA